MQFCVKPDVWSFVKGTFLVRQCPAIIILQRIFRPAICGQNLALCHTNLECLSVLPVKGNGCESQGAGGDSHVTNKVVDETIGFAKSPVSAKKASLQYELILSSLVQEQVPDTLGFY